MCAELILLVQTKPGGSVLRGLDVLVDARRGPYCPIAKGAEIFAERWTLLIIRNLRVGAHTSGARSQPAARGFRPGWRLSHAFDRGFGPRDPRLEMQKDAAANSERLRKTNQPHSLNHH